MDILEGALSAVAWTDLDDLGLRLKGVELFTAEFPMGNREGEDLTEDEPDGRMDKLDDGPLIADLEKDADVSPMTDV